MRMLRLRTQVVLLLLAYASFVKAHQLRHLSRKDPQLTGHRQENPHHGTVLGLERSACCQYCAARRTGRRWLKALC
jgi:3-hydroxymyristoyl/3-hydroxydecanoyl-(acyl carrier protein) dehydratase